MAPKKHDPRLNAKTATHCPNLHRYTYDERNPYGFRAAEKLATNDAKAAAKAHFGGKIKWRFAGVTRLPFGILEDGREIIAGGFPEYENNVVVGYRGIWGECE
jgi:hypothetical protein